VHQKINLAAVMQRKTTRFRVCTNDRKRFIIKEKRLWNSSTLVVALGAGLGVWGAINLLEGYGNDNPGSKSQGMKQLMAGGGVALVGITLIPLLSGLFG
jgi:hypothetical protein